MKLQMVDVLGQYETIRSEIDEAIHRVIKSGRFILGEEVGQLERDIAEYLGMRCAVGCASGTDALQIAMMALGIGSGDEVVTTPFTFVATAETIALLGAKPVYVDIDTQTFNLAPELVERAITPKTRAIIPVHLYGQAADMAPLLEVAGRHNLSVIEDSAQALGALYKERKVCSFGHVGCISFFPSKNLGGFGDGGMMVTDDEDLGKRLRMIAAHGSRERYYHDEIGVNSRLDTIQAAILKVKLRYLDRWNSRRRKAASRYTELLSDTPVVSPFVTPDAYHIYHQYTIRAPERDSLAAFLMEKKIPHAIYYPVPLHLQKAYRSDGFKRGDFPVAEQAAEEVLSLPMHTELTDEALETIAGAVRRFYQQRRV
ncbi:MAG: DegT/DnrJ/EryC1/StrS family aminotransferase [Bacteroidota bacterium]